MTQYAKEHDSICMGFLWVFCLCVSVFTICMRRKMADRRSSVRESNFTLDSRKLLYKPRECLNMNVMKKMGRSQMSMQGAVTVQM